MAPGAVSPVDQTSELLEKMNLETKTKSLSESDAAKKQSNGVNGLVPLYERSTTPKQSEYMNPSLCYPVPVNNYPFCYGAYEGIPQDWNEYMRYYNSEGVDVQVGVYGENGPLMYPHQYGYASYPFSPATSPAPVIDGPEQYQYPATYYSSLTANVAPFTPTSATANQGIVSEVAADQKQKPLSSESTNNAGLKLNNHQVLAKSTHTNMAAKGVSDPRFGYDASRMSLWADGQLTGSAITASAAGSNTAWRNRALRPQNHSMSRPMTGNVGNSGFLNRIFSNPTHTGYGYVASGYDSRINGRGWMAMDAKYRPRGRGNGIYGYGNENTDGLNELNRGPRAKRNIKGFAPVSKDQAAVPEEKASLTGSPLEEQYNKSDFGVDYSDAKFFIIKSYSEDDLHKSIKYNVWASTPNGNKKLNAAYQQAQDKSSSCPVFLFFSVNASGQFVGLAEMVSSVDFDKSLEYWQQDKWNGCFSLKWHIVKDVPNTLLKHIILENNENKPVTNSRDTQEVKLEQGLQMLKIFKDHSSRSSILDDFTFYEARQKAIQEKKVRLQFQKQVWEGKSADLKNQTTTDSAYTKAVSANGDVKMERNESIKTTGDGAVLA